MEKYWSIYLCGTRTGQPLCLGFIKAWSNTPFSLIASMPIDTEKPLSVVTTSLAFLKFWLMQSISPIICPQSPNSFGPSSTGLSLPSTSSTWNIILWGCHCRLCGTCYQRNRLPWDAYSTQTMLVQPINHAIINAWYPTWSKIFHVEVVECLNHLTDNNCCIEVAENW